MYCNPYESINSNQGKWLRSNFHCHAGTGKGTCGSLEIDEVVNIYKDAGYDVLTISNHDLFSDVHEYQEKYDITLINGFEYSKDEHMLLIGCSGLIEYPHQAAIDECNKQGGFAVLCHPNWLYKEFWPWQKVDILTGYTGIEIMNPLIFRLSGCGLATDTWDYLLSQGKIVWGFGNDDFHRWYDAARGWNMVYSSNKADDIKSAVNKGSFYVSTGLILNEFTVDDDTIKISATSKDTYVRTNKYIFIGKNGEILSEQFGEFGEYHIKGDELYIRSQVVSEHGAMLWTQPVFQAENFRRP